MGTRDPQFVSAVIIAFAANLAATFMAPLHGQSLANAAKKAEEVRAAKAKQEQSESGAAKKTDDSQKTDKAPTKKVYTDKDLADVPASSSSASASAETKTKTEPMSAPATPVADNGVNDNGVKTEAYWKARMAALRTNLSQATNGREAKAALVVRLTAVRDNVPDQGFSVAQAYAAASAELAKARSELETAVGVEKPAKTAISAAEEEARRLGVLPGWRR